jgi:CheY-like chemotaxis protein
MSQLDTGKFVLEPKEFSFKEMITAVSAAVSPPAKAKNQVYAINIAENIPDRLYADERRLKEVLLHLLSNAVKFTPEKGKIEVKAALAENADKETGGNASGSGADFIQLRFEVTDSGPGIPPEQKERLFHAFEQADNSITREHGGTGLGLAISKNIIKLMGGTIQAESAGFPGANSEKENGTKFIFTVTVKKLKQDTQTPATQNTGDLSGASLDDGALNLSGKRILVVDDVELNREIILTLLEDTGALLDSAENGAEAVRKFSESPCDLILMDIHMPAMDGLAAAKTIRAEGPAGAAVPIIAVTADADGGMRSKCLEAGMNDQIAKPVDFVMLFEIIKKHLA